MPTERALNSPRRNHDRHSLFPPLLDAPQATTRAPPINNKRRTPFRLTVEG